MSAELEVKAGDATPAVPADATPVAAAGTAAATTSDVLMPTFYISHGGGPCFWMEGNAFGMGWDSPTGKYLRSLSREVPVKPKALLIISAHWETAEVTVSTSKAPAMFYDYYGFPEHTYKLQYPAPGNPALAAKVKSMLEGAGIPCREDPKRGFDHGVFVPMLLAYPDADIPVVMLSLRADLDPAFHISVGKAIQPLRKEGVLIIGSGSSFHGFFQRGPTAQGATLFDDWLTDVLTKPHTAEKRDAALAAWSRAPGAAVSHPREEHLIPLHVAVGAAGSTAGIKAFTGKVHGGNTLSMFRFDK